MKMLKWNVCWRMLWNICHSICDEDMMNDVLKNCFTDCWMKCEINVEINVAMKYVMSWSCVEVVTNSSWCIIWWNIYHSICCERFVKDLMKYLSLNLLRKFCESMWYIIWWKFVEESSPQIWWMLWSECCEVNVVNWMWNLFIIYLS